ncbi:hypothetical protein EVA_06316 [gut metagenome]|uniref:Uncharacterized protein n=1 Tax=gut metagenome TaxID=749906 RepID=J9GSI2_9ZZZZ
MLKKSANCLFLSSKQHEYLALQNKSHYICVQTAA